MYICIKKHLHIVPLNCRCTSHSKTRKITQLALPDVSKFAKGSQNVKLSSLGLVFEFLFQEGNIFFNDLGILVTERSINLNGELVLAQGTNTSSVNQTAHLEHGNIEQHGFLVRPLFQISLDQTDQFTQ